MSYQVLARKWRPRDFDGVVGQDHVVRALRHALKEGRLHHAYLFTGTRGVGKTTLSRILAKSLNCVGPDGKGGVTDHPCGVCEACRAIDEGRFVDYIEMDAASNRGVDEMTTLLEQAMYPPTNARFKVYMIDEVHQLTSTAFNAMLKTLEEPPEYVKFILATTDPQKVPVTVLSRCLQFNLRNMAPQEISAHMADILSREGLGAEPGALRLLADGARGSMRDGLSLLDQAVSFSGGSVTEEGVRAMFGIVDSSVLFAALEALSRGDACSMIGVADEIGRGSYSYGQALRDLAGILHRAALAQMVPEAVSEDVDAERIREVAREFTADELQLYYQIAINGRNDLHLAPDEYAGFTMALLRMFAFKPAGSRTKARPAPEAEKKRPDAVTAAASGAATKIPTAAPSVASAGGAAMEPLPGDAARPAPKPQGSRSSSALPAGEAARPGPRPSEGATANAAGGAASDFPPESFSEEDWNYAAEELASSQASSWESGSVFRSWEELLRTAGLAEPLRQSAARSECLEFSSYGATLRNPVTAQTTEGVRRGLEEAFSKAMGAPFFVKFLKGEARDTEYGAQREEKRRADAKALADFTNAPLAQDIIRHFNGRVDENSVTTAKPARKGRAK